MGEQLPGNTGTPMGLSSVACNVFESAPAFDRFDPPPAIDEIDVVMAFGGPYVSQR